MDIQQLKMILDAVRGVSGDVSNMAGWWIGLNYGIEALKAILTAVVVIVLAVCMIRIFRASNEADSLCRAMATKLGVEGFDTWYGPDRKRLREAMESLRTSANP